MSKARTVQDYTRRLMRVVHQLWREPSRTYSLEQLAELAHFSPCHFHRVYREMVGETVTATQQRMRLLLAARTLNLPDAQAMPLSRIAMRAGYQSSAAFVRSFAAAHGITPGAYRRQRLCDLQSRISQELDMYSIEFRTLSAPLNLAARRHVGSYLGIGEAFAHLQLHKQSLPVDPEHVHWFAMYLDDPQTVTEAELRSDACIEIVASGDDLPDGLLHTQIPAGRYAVLTHRGPYAELPQAYHWLFGIWLPQSGEHPAAVPVIEHYLNLPYNTLPKDLRTELWVALQD